MSSESVSSPHHQSRGASGLTAWLFAAFLAFQIGCASLPPSESRSREEISSLKMKLMSLGETVDEQEAEQLADRAVIEARNLAREYQVVRPPWLHNVLVNHGFKTRGLCFEWTNDLFIRLLDLDLHSLDMHLIVARMDTPREHNSIALTAHGLPFSSGVVLDAWRGSGRIWCSPVQGDKYPWELLPPERINPEIRKRLLIGGVKAPHDQNSPAEPPPS
jgi:hypothetical protein